MRGTRLINDVMFHIVKYCEKLTYNVKVVDGDYNKFIDREHSTALDVCAFYILQIGELVNKLPDDFRSEHNDMPWRKIVDMRNRMAHGYVERG